MTYTVTVSRENGYWVGEVAGVPGGATETRRLSALEGEVRDLLSGLLDTDEDALDLEWHLEPDLADLVYAYHQAQEARRQAQEEYDSVPHKTVFQLRDRGLSLRDTAALLGVSFQRVQQLSR